jgi:hypothetical protein
MKDRDNVLRLLDEVDNAIFIFQQSIERKMPIDPKDAHLRFKQIRKKLEVITDRVSVS